MKSISHPASRPPDSIKTALQFLPLALGAAESKRIEPINAHGIHVTVPGEIEADDDDEVGEDKDGSFKVIAFALAVDVGEEEDAEDHGDHVPLREDQAGFGYKFDVIFTEREREGLT